MRQSSVRTPEDALAYITECTLATVDGLAMRKNPPANEFRRQKAIAQTSIDWMKEMNVKIAVGDRAYDIVTHFGGDVNLWARRHAVAIA